MAAEEHIMGLFTSEDQAASTIEALKGSEYRFIRAHMPFPSHRIMDVLKLKKNILIDTSSEENQDELIKDLEEIGLKPKDINIVLITHSHWDHIGNLKLFSKSKIISFRNIKDLKFSGIKVIPTPGHTKEDISFLYKDILFSGDTLFPGGPGRTASPEDFQEILSSLRTKIFVLPDDVHVFPGHGSPADLKKERENFTAFEARPHPRNLCGDVLWSSS